MTLTNFEWAVIAGFCAVLLGIVVHFVKGFIMHVESELQQRKADDVQLADILDKISERMYEHEKQDLERAATVASRVDLKCEIADITKRLDNIQHMIIEMGSRHVTHEECKRLHANGQ